MIIFMLKSLIHRHALQLTQIIESLTSIFPGDSDDKGIVCNVGDLNLSLGWAILRRERNPLIFLLENSMDQGAGRATVHGFSKSWTRLSD